VAAASKQDLLRMKAHAYLDRKADRDLEAVMALVAIMFNLRKKLDLNILIWEKNPCH
jgi:hypothetical protein